ncbi:MAG: hypothetical protein WBA41_08165 [Rivularia sp. (in: cyanobacteria)]
MKIIGSLFTSDIITALKCDRAYCNYAERDRYTRINPIYKSVMTIKELLLQEIDNTPNELLEDLLNFVRSLKKTPQQPTTYRELLERIDYLEAIVGIRKGLDEFERGEGIPAEQALDTLQKKFNIPPRP